MVFPWREPGKVCGGHDLIALLPVVLPWREPGEVCGGHDLIALLLVGTTPMEGAW